MLTNLTLRDHHTDDEVGGVIELDESGYSYTVPGEDIET